MKKILLIIIALASIQSCSAEPTLTQRAQSAWSNIQLILGSAWQNLRYRAFDFAEYFGLKRRTQLPLDPLKKPEIQLQELEALPKPKTQQSPLPQEKVDPKTKPEEAVIHSKIIEGRHQGKLLETWFYLVREPQAEKMATEEDVVADITLRMINNNFYLSRLHVNKKYRERLGYGELLFNLMKDYVRNYGAEKLSWVAQPFKLRAGESHEEMLIKLIKFYERQGGKVVDIDPIEASMELDLRPLGKRKLPWLPESTDTLSKVDYAKNIEIVRSLGASSTAVDEAKKKAMESPTPFVIIDLGLPIAQAAEKPIQSKL